VFEGVTRFLFGDDVFISYSRADGFSYAAALANELSKARLACSFDQLGSEPGADVPPSILRDLRRCGSLVILATERACESQSVEAEIRAFLPTRRTILPIDLSGAVGRARWWALIRGLAISEELPPTYCSQGGGPSQQSAASAIGKQPAPLTPSEAVISRIVNSVSFQTKDRRLRRAAWVAIITLTVSIIAALFSATLATKNAIRAVHLGELADEETTWAAFLSDAQFQLAEYASARASRLAARAQDALNTSSAVKKIETYLDFARLFYSNWDDGRGTAALKNANELINVLRNSPSDRRQGEFLLAKSYEVAGDLHWSQTADFAKNPQEYTAALATLTKLDAPSEDLARLHRKLAKSRLYSGDPKGAETELNQASMILADAKEAMSERALIDDVHAQMLLQRGDTTGARADFLEAIRLLRLDMTANRSSGDVLFNLACELTRLGDVQRLAGDGEALQSYRSSNELFRAVLHDDPTASQAQFGIDVDQHGIYLLGGDAATKSEKEEMGKTTAVAAAFDRAFGDGVGRFKFGMTVSQINSLLPVQFDLSTPLPIGPEFPNAEVRYLYVKSIRDLPDFSVVTQGDACLAQLGYVSFNFHEKRLFRVTVRFAPLPDRHDCPNRENVVDNIAERFGLVTSGGLGQRRIQYRTAAAALTARNSSVGTSVDFVRQ
jgi:hypothetical protein